MKQIIQHISAFGFVIPILLFLYLLNPFNLGYLPGLAILPFLVVRQAFFKNALDFNVFILSVFSFSYALFYSLQASETQGNQFIIIYALTPPSFYLLGKFLATGLQTKKSVAHLYFLLFTLFSISAVISVFTNFLTEGFGTFERNLPMFWSGRIIPATIMGAFMTFNMCIPGLVMARIGKSKGWIIGIMLLVFVLSLISVIRLGSRTQLAIFLLASIVSLFYVVPRQSFRTNVILITLLIAVVYYIQTLVSFDLSEDWLTNFADRIDSRGGNLQSGGGRVERWEKSVDNLFSKPTGWSVQEFGHSHNLWLDAARVSGILPFLALLIFTFRSLGAVRNFLKWNHEDVALNANIIIYTMAFFLVFMVEPIFEGIFSLFAIFCLFIGLIKRYPDEYDYVHAPQK